MYLCKTIIDNLTATMDTIALVPVLFNLGTGEIIVIALVVLLLFGGRKIPELMRGLGKGVKSFKQGMAEVSAEINSADKEDTAETGTKQP